MIKKKSYAEYEYIVHFDSRFWDCECLINYHHSKKINMCNICGACEEDSPDSRIEELIKFYGENYKDKLHLIEGE